MQQDDACAERIFAEPERLAEASARSVHAGALPAPFVFGKAAPEVAGGEQRLRQVRMRVGVRLVDADGLLETAGGLGMLVERLQRAAAIVQPLQVVRREREHLVVSRDS